MRKSVKYEFCQTLMFECSLLSYFAQLANELWYTVRVTIVLPKCQIYSAK